MLCLFAGKQAVPIKIPPLPSCFLVSSTSGQKKIAALPNACNLVPISLA